MSLNQSDTIVFNGEVRSFEGAITMQQLLKQENIMAKRFVVVLNDEVISKVDWDDTMIHSGDVIDIVSPISGG